MKEEAQKERTGSQEGKEVKEGERNVLAIS